MGMPSSDLVPVAPDCGSSEVGSFPKFWPPGFRFHPTDEELVLYYLKRKVCRRRMLDMIGETDVYKCEPWELPEKSSLQSGDKQWFFFSHRDKKYPNGSRANRATKRGYWKATGKDRSILCKSRQVGLKKTLIFYDGRAPSGKRTDWVMHEYTMNEEELKKCNSVQDGYAVYKVYKKSGSGPKNGEQYGAPFREERWSDDEPCRDSHQVSESGEDTSPKIAECPFLEDDLGVNWHNWHSSTLSNIEEILGQITDAPDIGQQSAESRACEISTEEGTEYTVAQLIEEALLVEAATKVPNICEGGDIQYIAGSSASILQPCGEPEALPLPCSSELEYPLPVEGNYVEIHDLLDPIETCISGIEDTASDNFSQSFIEGFSVPEQYHDASVQELDSFDGMDANQLDDLLLMNSLDGGNLYHYNPQVVTSELWSHDQNLNAFISAESSQYEVVPPVSGIAYEGSSGSISEMRQHQLDNIGGDHGNAQGSQDADSVSWFNSAIYSVLERIPTSSASASETGFINRALLRMSSFGAVRKASGGRGDAVAASGVSFSVPKRRPNGDGGYFFISILVLIWALLWLIMIGIFVKAFKAFTGRYISS